MTLGLSSRLLSGASGQEYASYSLGKIFYLDKARVGLRDTRAVEQPVSTEALVSEFNLRFGSRWQLDSHQIWSSESEQWQELGAALHYRLNQRRMVTLGARKRLASAQYFDEAVEQIEISTIGRRQTAYRCWRAGTMTCSARVPSKASWGYNTMIAVFAVA